ncbi:hypothetical protein GW17_00021730 [Ensete ventricosum]|nr:hypothetical protein GW17_00021730 [Ensete ventricosum]
MPPLRRVRDITSSSVGSAIWFSTSTVSRVHRQVLARGESSRVWLGVTPGILTKGTETTKEDDGIPGRGAKVEESRREPRKEASAQEGFNIGFKQSASSGYKWGIVRGITSAFVSLPDQFKEKLVKKLEDRGTFQSLYKPVQEISTDDALRMYQFQLLQENKQSHQRSKGKFQATISSASEDFDCNKLDFFFNELMLLVRESSEIKASVDGVKGEEEE